MTSTVSKEPPAQETPPATPSPKKAKTPSAFLTAGVILGWGVDLLFWNKPAGISIAIWIILALAGLFLLAYNEKTRHAKFR